MDGLDLDGGRVDVAHLGKAPPGRVVFPLLRGQGLVFGQQVGVALNDGQRRFELMRYISEKLKTHLVVTRFDFIILDCPPSLGLLTLNALCAAKEILVPLQCEFFALEGIVKLLQTYEQVKKRLNPQLGLLGVVLTMFDGRNRLTRQVQDEVNRCFPDQIFKTVIPRTVRLSEAPSFGKSILHYDIKSKGSEAYLSLAKEIVMRKPGSRTAKAE